MNRLLALMLLLATVHAAKIPERSTQLIVVRTADWRSSHGVLRFYERGAKGAWRMVEGPFPVVLGRRGTAKGLGIGSLKEIAGPTKREGDLRAPAGLFALPFAFGEGPNPGTRFPWHRMSSESRCVDDPRSRWYNRIVEVGEIRKDWHSAERMIPRTGLYRRGIFVAHNPRRIPGRGSCIFVHIRRSDGGATVGCTALSAPAIERVIRRLDPARHPLLLQGPPAVIVHFLPEGFGIRTEKISR